MRALHGPCTTPNRAIRGQNRSRPASDERVGMRALALNVLSAGAAVLLLVLLARAATSILDRPVARDVPATRTELEPAEAPRRVFGVYVDPWHVDD
jgi:hypothetical protein